MRKLPEARFTENVWPENPNPSWPENFEGCILTVGRKKFLITKAMRDGGVATLHRYWYWMHLWHWITNPWTHKFQSERTRVEKIIAKAITYSVEKDRSE